MFSYSIKDQIDTDWYNEEWLDNVFIIICIRVLTSVVIDGADFIKLL